MNLQIPNDFHKDLIHEINSAKKEIYIESMIFESGEILDEIVDSLISAAQRGVKVKVIRDWISQVYVKDELPIFVIPFTEFWRKAKKVHARNLEIIKKLSETSNIDITVNNKKKFLNLFFSFFGRNHMKLYVVDNLCWIGGINLSDKSFEKIDFVVKIDNSNLTQEIINVFENNFENKKIYDFNKIIGDVDVLVDGGKRGSSIIYKEAIEIISSAKTQIIFMSQFIPDGKILEKILEKAREGINIYVITSNSDNGIFTKYPQRYFYLKFLKKIKNFSNIKLIHLEKHVHVKLIDVDNSRLIFGSHNFVMPGVRFGTKEIALKTKNSELNRQIDDYLRPFLNI